MAKWTKVEAERFVSFKGLPLILSTRESLGPQWNPRAMDSSCMQIEVSTSTDANSAARVTEKQKDPQTDQTLRDERIIFNFF